MPVIRLRTMIAAPIESCFDAARNIDLHVGSTARTKEKAVGGVTVGLIGPGEIVTWEAVHLGIKQRLTTRITEYQRPYLFTDVMVRGAFHSFTHTHEFRPAGQGTLMIDTFTYEFPLGFLGRLVDNLFLERYMKRFLRERALYLKRATEAHNLLAGP